MNPKEFPIEFQQFLEDNEVDEKEYQICIPRYINVTGDPKLVEEALQCKLKKHWFRDFFEVPSNVSVKTSMMGILYYGMDVSSAIACDALEIERNDHVLDLCCAPGAKSRYISDLLGDGFGTITGVDIAKHRLSTAKNLLRKHKFDRFRLYLDDGTAFNVPPPSYVGSVFVGDEDGDYNTLTSAKPFYSTRLLRNQSNVSKTQLYDKVIVDSECTHDGSMMHIKKYVENGWSGFKEQFLDPKKLERLETLQRGLLQNGYDLCKIGGIIVYSTCSLSPHQNEGILDWFLDANPKATLEPICNIPDSICRSSAIYSSKRSHNLENCMRFTPQQSNMSGFFVAKIRKS